MIKLSRFCKSTIKRFKTVLSLNGDTNHKLFEFLQNIAKRQSVIVTHFGRGRWKTKGCVSNVKYIFDIKPNFSARVVSTPLGYLTVQIWEKYPLKYFENCFL